MMTHTRSNTPNFPWTPNTSSSIISPNLGGQETRMSREDWPELELEGRWKDVQVGLNSSESQERAALLVALGSIKKSSLFLSHNGTFHKRTHMDSRYVPQGVIEGWSRAGIITKSGRQHRFYLIEPAPNQA